MIGKINFLSNIFSILVDKIYFLVVLVPKISFFNLFGMATSDL